MDENVQKDEVSALKERISDIKKAYGVNGVNDEPFFWMQEVEGALAKLETEITALKENRDKLLTIYQQEEEAHKALKTKFEEMEKASDKMGQLIHTTANDSYNRGVKEAMTRAVDVHKIPPYVKTDIIKELER